MYFVEKTCLKNFKGGYIRLPRKDSWWFCFTFCLRKSWGFKPNSPTGNQNIFIHLKLTISTTSYSHGHHYGKRIIAPYIKMSECCPWSFWLKDKTTGSNVFHPFLIIVSYIHIRGFKTSKELLRAGRGKWDVTVGFF